MWGGNAAGARREPERVRRREERQPWGLNSSSGIHVRGAQGNRRRCSGEKERGKGSELCRRLSPIGVLRN